MVSEWKSRRKGARESEERLSLSLGLFRARPLKRKSDLHRSRHPIAFSEFSLRRRADDERCKRARVAERPNKRRSNGRRGSNQRVGGLAASGNRDRRPGLRRAAAAKLMTFSSEVRGLSPLFFRSCQTYLRYPRIAPLT